MSGRSGIAIALAFAAVAVIAVVIVVTSRDGPASAGTGDPAAAPPGEGMMIEVFADKEKDERVCGAGEPLRKCGEVLIGDAFSLDVLASAIPAEGYTRFQVALAFSGDIFNVQNQDGFDEVIWPDEGCDLVGRGEEVKEEDRYIITCKRAGSTNSFYTGPLVNVQFTCKGKGTGTIELVGGNSIDDSSYYHRPSISGSLAFLEKVDSVQVNCFNLNSPTPTATPTDTATATPTDGLITILELDPSH